VLIPVSRNRCAGQGYSSAERRVRRGCVRHLEAPWLAFTDRAAILGPEHDIGEMDRFLRPPPKLRPLLTVAKGFAKDQSPVHLPDPGQTTHKTRALVGPFAPLLYEAELPASFAADRSGVHSVRSTVATQRGGNNCTTTPCIRYSCNGRAATVTRQW